MAMHLGHFTVISLAENVTTLNSVLPVCQGGHNAQCLKSITILDGVNGPGTTLKGTRGSAMVELSNRETFKPRNRLSKAEMVVACSPVVLRHLWRAVLNHVGCTRCIRWSWERTRVVGCRPPQGKAKQKPQRDTVMTNQDSTNALLGSLVVGHVGWWKGRQFPANNSNTKQ